MKSKFLILILGLSTLHSCRAQSTTKTLITNWNTAFIESLDTQITRTTDSFYLKEIIEKRDFIKRYSTEGAGREYLIDKIGVNKFNSNITIIHVTNIHDEYAYVIREGKLSKYLMEDGKWMLKMQKPYSSNLENETLSQLNNTVKCSNEPFELALFTEISVTKFDKKIQVTYLVKICKHHIDVLAKLNDYLK